MKRISKKDVQNQWEAYYAEAVLQMEKDGLFLNQVKSHTNGKDSILRVHPAFGVFEKSASELGKLEGWHKTEETNQLNLDF